MLTQHAQDAIKEGNANLVVFTFGYGQAFPGYHVKAAVSTMAVVQSGKSANALARDAMFEYFGSKWCMDYDHVPSGSEKELGCFYIEPYDRVSWELTVVPGGDGNVSR